MMTQTSKGQPQVGTSDGSLGEHFPADLFKALSDPSRLDLLIRLAVGRDEATVSEVASCCTIDMSVVSRHLAALRDAGVLEARKRGRQVFYTVRYDNLSKTLRSMADALDACCPPVSQSTCCGGEALEGVEN